MKDWPDLVEILAFALFAGDLAVRGHASDVAGIVGVLIVRLARHVWPAPLVETEPTNAETHALREDLNQLKSDVSRLSLVAGITASQ